MQERLKKVFLKAIYTPEKSLADQIWHAIALHNKRITRLKIWTFSLTGSASLLFFIPMLKILLNDFTRSGFYEYLSLAFSNGGSLIAYWKDFLSLLAESLPVISIISTLTLVFIFFLSLKYVMRTIIKSQPELAF